jgi:hypothetical protein
MVVLEATQGLKKLWGKWCKILFKKIGVLQLKEESKI